MPTKASVKVAPTQKKAAVLRGTAALRANGLKLKLEFQTEFEHARRPQVKYARAGNDPACACGARSGVGRTRGDCVTLQEKVRVNPKISRKPRTII